MTEPKATCPKCKKEPLKSPRSKWGRNCYKARRTLQLKRNNVTWRKRVVAKKAGHWVRYRNHPTEWAVEHKEAALKQAKKYKIPAQSEEAIKIVEKGVHAKPQKTERKVKEKILVRTATKAKPEAKKKTSKPKAKAATTKVHPATKSHPVATIEVPVKAVLEAAAATA